MSEYFPKPLRNYGRNVKVGADLSNYATKTDIKNISKTYLKIFQK